MKCTFSIFNKEKFLNVIFNREPKDKIDKNSCIFNSMFELFSMAEEYQHDPTTILILKKDLKSGNFLIKKILSINEMEKEYRKYLRYKILI